MGNEFIKDICNSFLIYLAIINLAGFIMAGLDKYYAKHQKWRIREKSFFVLALFGGAVGVLLGMKTFHHKTQHKSFTIGIPLMIGLHIVIFLALLFFIYGK